MDPKTLQDLFSAGPIGVYTILSLVIVFLFWTWTNSVNKKDQQIQILNDKLIDMTGRLESITASSKSAIELMVESAKESSRTSDDRFETIRIMFDSINKVALLVSGNGDSIQSIKTDLTAVIKEMRADIREALFRGERRP